MKTPIHWLNRSLILALLTTVPASAETYTWTGAASSEWNDPANWNPSTGVPGAADTAIVSSGSPSMAGDVSVARLEFSGGTLTGAGTLTVTNALVWNGASTMLGGGTTVIGPGAIATLSGDGDRGLNTRTLINRGTLRQPGPCRLTLYNDCRVENQAGALVDWQGDVSWDYTGGNACSVTNAGTFRKSGGTGVSRISGLVPNTAGRVEAQVGLIDFPNGVVATGTFEAAEGAVIRFQSACTLTDVTLSGPGEQRFENGTYLVVGTVNAQNLLLVSGTWQGTNTLSGLLTWAGGNVYGPGTTTISPPSTLRLVGTGDRNLNTRTLINQGTIEHTGTCRLTFYNAVRVENQAGGLVDLPGDVLWDYTGGNACSVLNAGTFRKSAGPGTCTLQGLTFDNTGTLGPGRVSSTSRPPPA